MKKLTLLAFALALLPWMGISAADTDQYVPSNWGGWKNLSLGTTDTTYYTKVQLPMDVQVSGQTVHVAWTDWKPNAAGEYCLWYRRSTDGGRTWEEPRAVVKSATMRMTDLNNVGATFGCNAKWMEVEGQNVHFVTTHNSQDGGNGEVWYTCSHDGGQTFETRTIADGSQGDGHYYYGRPHVVADGQTLVIAFQGSRYGGSAANTNVLTSFDGGATFNAKQIGTKQSLADLQVSGRQWAVLGNFYEWNYMMLWGNVYISTSNDGGETITTQNIAPIVIDSEREWTDRSWGDLNYMKGGNGASYNYHAQMTLEGDVINVIYEGCIEAVEDKRPTNDRAHTVFCRSTDFGKTWTDAMYLPESNGSAGAIAAKGQHIYVLQTPKKLQILHSHDGGQTWEQQERGTKSNEFYNFYDLYVAPDDATGQHVYLTGVRGLLTESKDGFRTIHRNFAIGSESWDYKDWNNQSLTVRLDSEGTEHWLMNYSAPYKASTPYFWSIVYRRNDPAPATTDQEMALDISVPEERLINYPLTNVIIPMTPSLMEAREAMTVECWVRIDKLGTTSDIVALTNSDTHAGGSIYRGGWYMDVHRDGDSYSFYAGLSTELSWDDKGQEVWDRWRYRVTDLGVWHHLALTYDSRVEQDNIRFYIDGMLMGTQTDRGLIAMGNNPIVIGPNSVNSNVNETYVDNFAVFSRALTHDEIMQHIYNKPDAKDKDCRLLLTFDGSLHDQSQYHNDPAPLLENNLKAHDGIRPPHPEFIASKDMTGKIISLSDATEDGEACWWILPDKWNLSNFTKYSTKTGRFVQHDVRNQGSTSFNGLYTYYMVARGTGDCNAYAATSQTVIVGGLNKVFPDEAAPSSAVRLRIQGGYELTYSKQPKVVLKQGDQEIEGKWLIEYGYSISQALKVKDLPEVLFDMSSATPGRYDVIVGNDTLSQGFTLTSAVNEEPDVWLQVNGRGRSLWNKWQQYTIDYGNKSGAAAYNTPIFLVIPERYGTVDVAFEFSFERCNIALDDYGQELARQLGDYLKTYDEKTGDTIRIYSFMIPYIAPKSTNQLPFRIRMKQDFSIASNEITMYYWAEQPWGPYDPDAPNPYGGNARTRAPYTMEQGECFAAAMGLAAVETAIGFIPGVGCIYSAGKTIYQVADSKQRSVSSFLVNLVSTGLSCVAGPAGVLGDMAFRLAGAVWNGAAAGIGASDCLNGDPKSRNNKGVGSYDPNEMIGPWGYDDDKHYIKPIHNMAYTITFENKSSATAPAHEVFVSDTLDLSKFDAETFTFTSCGWADTTLVVGDGKTYDFSRDVAYKVGGQDILVRVSGQFDAETGIVRWIFASLDKNGNEIDDPDLGFLVPNNDNHDGEGFVSFSIEHKANPANGSTISNKATIIFDANEPITTNTYVNTFDTDYPTSKVKKAEERDGQIVVTIEGNDATSGIDHYTLYAFVNDGSEAEVVAASVTGTQATFACEPGTKYALCTIATDRVGWREPKDLKAEVTLTTGGSSPVQPTTIDLAVAEAGYATFYDSQNAYQLPADLKASTVSGSSGSKLSYQALSGSIVPKGTAVLIEASTKKAATYTLTSTNDEASYTGENLLHGSDVATTTSADGQNVYYKLAYGPSGTSLAQSFGWFWGAQQGAAFRIEGHRAWLAIPQGAAARGYLISGEGTDAVEYVALPTQQQSSFTDLQGRRIATPTQPGIYFKDGRKIVVK